MANSRAAAERAEKAAHQAILRIFAATGLPPAASDLDPVLLDLERCTAGAEPQLSLL